MSFLSNGLPSHGLIAEKFDFIPGNKQMRKIEPHLVTERVGDRFLDKIFFGGEGNVGLVQTEDDRRRRKQRERDRRARDDAILARNRTILTERQRQKNQDFQALSDEELLGS